MIAAIQMCDKALIVCNKYKTQNPQCATPSIRKSSNRLTHPRPLATCLQTLQTLQKAGIHQVSTPRLHILLTAGWNWSKQLPGLHHCHRRMSTSCLLVLNPRQRVCPHPVSHLRAQLHYLGVVLPAAEVVQEEA